MTPERDSSNVPEIVHQLFESTKSPVLHAVTGRSARLFQTFEFSNPVETMQHE
jgi:hypothetical protein